MRISRNLMVDRRVRKLRRKIRTDTQQIRAISLEGLREIFELAASLARGKYDTQTEGGETLKVSLKQRQMWARVAGYVAQVMNSIAHGFDEREIDVQLDKLERLVNEAKARAEDRKTRERTA